MEPSFVCALEESAAATALAEEFVSLVQEKKMGVYLFFLQQCPENLVGTCNAGANKHFGNK